MKLEIERAKAVSGEVSVPGDKSISHRILILASIARGTSLIRNICPGRDVESTACCMRQLGASIEERPQELLIHGTGRGGLVEPGDILDCGNSGTTARLIMGLVSGYPFCTIFTGDISLRERPMGRVREPLARMGARIDGRKDGDRLPISVRGGELQSITYTMPIASAQVKSAILLAGLAAEGVTTVIEKKLTRDHTERLLAAMGGGIRRREGSISLEGGKELSPLELYIPADFSSAAFPMALAAISPGSSILIKNVGINPTRTGFISLLEKMGAKIVIHQGKGVGPEPVGDIEISYSELSGITVTGEEAASAIDELPLLAVVATQAEGCTSIQGASELRLKEADRIGAITDGLRKMGADVTEEQDGLTVKGPARLHGATCASYGDHRIAMSLAVAGWVADGKTTITDSECIAISFPGFISCIQEVISS